MTQGVACGMAGLPGAQWGGLVHDHLECTATLLHAPVRPHTSYIKKHTRPLDSAESHPPRHTLPRPRFIFPDAQYTAHSPQCLPYLVHKGRTVGLDVPRPPTPPMRSPHGPVHSARPTLYTRGAQSPGYSAESHSLKHALLQAGLGHSPSQTPNTPHDLPYNLTLYTKGRTVSRGYLMVRNCEPIISSSTQCLRTDSPACAGPSTGFTAAK